MSLEAVIEAVVANAVQQALAPYIRRLAEPEPLVYSVREAAHVLGTSPNTVRRLIDEGVLPTVPHMGQRLVIPRVAVQRLIEPVGPGAAGPDPEAGVGVASTG